MLSRFRLLIFDMDDTLAASGALWRRAESRLFAQLGHAYDPQIADRYKGMNAQGVGQTIHALLQPPGYSADACGRLLRQYLLETFAGPLDPMPGADAMVRWAAGRFTLALASGSPLEAIQQVLARFGWTALFTLVLSSEGMRGKPEPDVFLEVARRLAIPPAEAVVFEDSLNGVRAAKRAGMTCIAIPSSTDPRIREEADCTFTSFDEIITAMHEDICHEQYC